MAGVRATSPASAPDTLQVMVVHRGGFPLDMFPVLFAIPRTAGWMAQWEEMLTDPEQKIARPRQIFIGAPHRDYGARDKRLW